MSNASLGLSSSASERPIRSWPRVAVVLVAVGASLLIAYGVWAAEALSAATQGGQGQSSLGGPVTLHFTFVGTDPWVQAVSAFGTGGLLFVVGWWMFWRPRLHVTEGLLACVAAASCVVVVGGINGGLLLPSMVAAAGGLSAIAWSPTARANRVRVAKRQSHV